MGLNECTFARTSSLPANTQYGIYIYIYIYIIYIYIYIYIYAQMHARAREILTSERAREIVVLHECMCS